MAARAQRERQRQEGEQVAGRADRDDDEVDGFDASLLVALPLLYPKHAASLRSKRCGSDSGPELSTCHATDTQGKN